MGARHRHTGCDAAARHSARGRWCAAPLLASAFLLVAPGARAEAADPAADAEPAPPPTAPVSGPEQADKPAAVDEGSPPPAQAAVVTPAAAATPAPEQGAARPLPIEKIFTRETLAATPTPEESPGPRSTHRSEAGAGAQSGTLPRLGAPLRALQGYLALVRRRLASGGEPPRRTLLRLRRSLEAVTPAVEERRVGAPRPPAVRRRLRRARASADAVVVLIRRSELRGPAVRRLLPWLVRFRGPVAVLAPQPATTAPDVLTPA